MITIKVHHKARSNTTNFYIVSGNGGSLLSFKTAENLGILHITRKITSIASTAQIISKFPEIFKEGIGKIRGQQVTLHINPDVIPKQQRHRRIPFHIRKDIEKELERLEWLDIIEKADGPTPWVSPIVAVPKKNGEIRICVDMREANQAILREKHPMPTIDELIADLNGSTLFSTLDLTNAYHQLELDPESRYITTFSTHIGLHRYKRSK